LGCDYKVQVYCRDPMNLDAFALRNDLKLKPQDIFYCGIKDVKAEGRQTDNGFVVLRGSRAVLEERPSTQKYRYAANLRSALLQDGILIKTPTHLEFNVDFEFSSPSAAAAVIHGGQANGLTAWKDSKGLSLKQREEEEIQQGSGGNG
jgi:Domain of unknown function (DUF4357)